MKCWQKNKKLTGYGLALPMVVGFTMFYVIPVFVMCWYSVSWGIGKREFVGLENFVDLFRNEMFLLAAKNTFRFLCVGVPCILILSLVVALMLQKVVKISSRLRTIYFYPLLIPIASLVMFVQNIFGEDMIESEQAFWILCLIYVWKFFGYHVLIMYARLQMIPKDYYDNARLYGAGTWERFHFITMPLLMPVFLFNVVLAVMNAFKCYREAFLLGGNYPDESVYLLQHFINNSFQNLNYQKISTTSVSLLVVILICVGICYMIYRLGRRRQYA